MSENIPAPTVPASAWIAETAVVRGDVTLGENSSVWFGAVIRGDVAPIFIGAETNVQDLSVIHVNHNMPCHIGSRITIGHRAIVHACTLEDEVLVGMGAIVLDGAHIERGAVIGAGALVPPRMFVPAGSLVLGVPGKIIGPASAEQQAYTARAVANYVQLKETYRRGDL